MNHASFIMYPLVKLGTEYVNKVMIIGGWKPFQNLKTIGIYDTNTNGITFDGTLELQ